MLSILVLGLLAVGFASAADYPADDIANMESATGEMLNLADNDTADILSTDDSTDINTIENENNGLDESKTDKTYARIDGLDGKPGYFTVKASATE